MTLASQARVRACLIDVYDTILVSRFASRMEALIGPLGIGVGDWLAEWDKLREDRDRGRLTVAASFARTLPVFGIEPEPDLVVDLTRRDAEYSRAFVRLCDDTVPFLQWLRSEGVLTALVSNCADTTRAHLGELGVLPLVDAVVLSCEVGSVKPYPEIYATALDELGIAAVDAVFIDDQPTYCVGAQAVGIRPIQIARREVGGGASQWNLPVVHSLFEASSLLSGPLTCPSKLPFEALRVAGGRRCGMAPGDDGRRSALLITTAAYADTQLLWLRPPVSGATDLAAALAAPQAGGFAVDMLTDGTETEAHLAIQRFLAGRSADETILLYLACHAIRDRARLYFAATDTWLRYPQRSALPAATVLSELDRCGAGKRLLILDCCFSGGFAEETGELDLATELGLPGRDIALLSGSGAREYSYEGRPIGPELPRSVFTEGLAVGLATGAADVDGNGIVTVAEAYNYAHRHVSQNAPRQAPQYYLEDGHADIVLARAQARTGPHAYLPVDVPDVAPPIIVNGAGWPADYGQRPDAPVRPATRGAALHAASAQSQSAPALSAQSQPAHARPAEAAGGALLEQDRDNAYCVAFSPDGMLLASGGWGRPVRLRDVVSGGLVRELRSLGPSVYDLAFSPEGALIATGGRDGTVALCEVATGKKGRTRKPGGAAVRAVAFAPDGGLLMSAHEDGVARLWDVPALGRVSELRADGETIFGAAFSPDGTLVAAACADGAVRLWGTADGGAPLTVLRRHTGWATGVGFTPDGTRLVSSGADGTVQLHDAHTGKVSVTLRGGDGIVNAIAISPDGTLIVGGYETGVLTVWEVESGDHESMTAHAGHVNDVAFSPHGRALASAGKDGAVRLWR